MEEIKFSIIVPVYNIEKYICQCVDSILSQTYSNLEIILVNDGSTDNSLSILNDYAKKDARIIIVDKKNGGLSSARNAGIDVCMGDYISFIDGDDWVAENMYATAYSSIREQGWVDLITFSFYNYYATKDIVVFSYKHEGCKTGMEFYAESNYYVNAWSKIYSAKRIKNGNYRFIPGIIHEDIPFTTLYTIESDSVVNIDIPLYYYRRNRTDSILNSLNEKSINDKAYVISYLIQKSKELNYLYKPLNDRIFLYWISSFKTSQYGSSTNSDHNIFNTINAIYKNNRIRNIVPIISHSSYKNTLRGFLGKICPIFLFKIYYYHDVFIRKINF